MSDDSRSAFDAIHHCTAGDLCPNLLELRRLREELGELSALVRTDELTGLFNYRYFNQALELEMERTRRSGQATVLIMIDLDHFKEINDAYGHEFGNRTLNHIAAIIRRTTRKLDIACRYGGEEFTVILPDTRLPEGTLFANRIRRLVRSVGVRHGKGSVKLTASFGVDVYSYSDTRSVEEFVKDVDRLLYLAKDRGRDRVCAPNSLDSAESHPAG
ncbi:MAG: GGDEF domain-containing protein [Pseudohongiellaceae bacterium]